MLLAVDIGNTSIKFGIFDGDTLTSRFSIPTNRDATADAIKVAVEDRLPADVSKAIVCSVVPTANDAIREFLREATNVDPVIIDNSFDFGLEINYQPLASLGTDRLVNAFAAVEKYGSPVIVCSLGTATTIDVVNADREFIGGIIAPGMEAMAEALHAKAPRLPVVNLDSTPELVGRTTVDSIRSGIYNGYVAMVAGLIDRIRRESNVTRVVGTGGNALRVSKELDGMMKVERDLLLVGLRVLADWNAGVPPA